jgi:methylmalonyl-CoA mutase N-terminal domain/subunit
VDTFAPRLSFFFASHNDLFEEVAKFRAARRIYARIMRERFGASEANARLRFHTQTGGVTLTAQQPLNNVVRVTVQTLAAALGGTQSLHTNGYDEALSLPTAEAATLALRTQQIVAYESGIANTVDPLAGSYYVESLTDKLIAGARDLIAEIDAMGGAVAAVESGWMQDQIGESAYRAQQAIERGEQVVVGVNRFNESADGVGVPIQRIDPAIERDQIARTRAFRAQRDQVRASTSLAEIRRAADGKANLMPLFVEAVDAGATLGEICGVLREAFGTHVARERIA